MGLGTTHLFFSLNASCFLLSLSRFQLFFVSLSYFTVIKIVPSWGFQFLHPLPYTSGIISLFCFATKTIIPFVYITMSIKYAVLKIVCNERKNLRVKSYRDKTIFKEPMAL
ncbi:hypothetical protein ERO13_A09G130550v2 [Gossypium hirsutum]|nr:hypothetical protein ERO13_A09G130550v2 [Gossypium hirsutum]